MRDVEVHSKEQSVTHRGKEHSRRPVVTLHSDGKQNAIEIDLPVTSNDLSQKCDIVKKEICSDISSCLDDGEAYADHPQPLSDASMTDSQLSEVHDVTFNMDCGQDELDSEIMQSCENICDEMESADQPTPMAVIDSIEKDDCVNSETDNDQDSVADPDYQPPHSESGTPPSPSSTLTTDSSFTQEHTQSVITQRKHTITRKSVQSTKVSSKPSQGRKKAIHVKQAKAQVDGRRIWDRKHFCLYCNKEIGNMYRHFERIHKTETAVAQALSFKKHSSERLKLLRKLKHKGNYIHNYEVAKTGIGEVVPYRRPSCKSKKTGGDYLPCNHCFGLFSRKVISKHVRSCQLAEEQTNQNTKKNRRRYQKAASYLMPVAHDISKIIQKNVLPHMMQDDITTVARKDSLIMKCASRAHGRNADLSSIKVQVSERIRSLGRLLIKLRELDSSITHLQDAINPSKFSTVVQAVRFIAEYDEEKGTYSTPSLALKLGHFLKTCAQIIVSQSVQTESKEDEERANRYINLHNTEWENQISSIAVHTFELRRSYKPKLLPLTKDVMKLNNRLRDIMSSTEKNLKEKKLVEASWASLCKATLAQVILFNRCREGEVSRMLLKTYEDNKDNNSVGENDEVDQSLTPLEKSLSRQLIKIEIPGKGERNMPVLLTPQLKDCVNLLCDLRKEASVHPKNPYVFARQYDSKECQRADQCLRLYAWSCGATNPERLTSTKLRKHVATISQFLNLSDNELHILADFLGHNINVHQNHYRLPQATMEVCRISRLLMSLESRDANIFRGKTLDQIATDVAIDTSTPEEKEEEIASQSTPPDNRTEEVQQESVVGEVTDVVNDQQTIGHSAEGCENPGAHKLRRPRKHVKWTQAEKTAIQRALKEHYAKRILPKKADCVRAIQEEPALRRRSWHVIKDHVRNWITKNLS
ncbi:uncharacterized protein [Ptychodera flava]|uniref:uncharacterized protein n=1 Tax=Ptychodera flava TaxID=63121 RepID=UPI003969CE21